MTASGFRSSCEASSTKRRWVRTPSIEPVEHRVERVGEIAHLVGWTAETDPPREIGRLDLPRDAGDRADGPHDAARDGPPDGQADRHQHEERREREIANPLERLLADGLFHLQEGIGRPGVAASLELGEAHAEDPQQLFLECRRLLLRDRRGHRVQGQVHAQHEHARRHDQGCGHQHREPEADRSNGRGETPEWRPTHATPSARR